MPFIAPHRHAFLLVIASLFACNGSPARVHVPPSNESAVDAGVDASTSSVSGDERDNVVLVTDVAALDAVEAKRGNLGHLVDGKASSTNSALAEGRGYGSIADVLETDVRGIARSDRNSGVGVGNKPHRLFDAGWLRSAKARFELIGIANRIDRRGLDPRGCGEIRFIYRLSYSTERQGVKIASRLPATIAVSYWAQDDHGLPDCRPVAERWRLPKGISGDALGNRLVAEDGPLASSLVARDRMKAVEVNLQIVRWPSTVRPDMGGHAEYLLRAFRPGKEGGFAPGPLDNTPDIERISKDKGLRSELVHFLREAETLQRIDAGTVLVPEKFLATRAISVSPRGLARRANRPFRSFLDPKTLGDLSLSGLKVTTSKTALVRKLDELSCQGCHQSRSVAGFHLLGEDGPTASAGNAIAIPISPHLTADLDRRRRELVALATGASPLAEIPFPERGENEAGIWGAHCGLTSDAPAKWTCNEGLTCTEDDASTDDGDVGICLPKNTPGPGDPCEIGRIRPNADSHRERVESVIRRDCGAGVCEVNSVGFPGGMCSTSCSAMGKSGGCGAIAILSDFNACLAQKLPFEKCLSEHTRPAGLRACDVSTPCRDDYICAKGTGARGTCIPPYFLFQLRVDGHPSSKGPT